MRFTGRTKYFLSAFGEHLISEEIEKAIAAGATALGTNAIDFHVGPVFPAGEEKIGHHLYLIEFTSPIADARGFMRLVDQKLNELNEDYAAHRKGDISLLAPRMKTVRPGGFTAWMRAHGKLGGQHKLPRMDNTGKLTGEMRDWLESNGYSAGEPAVSPAG